MPRRPSGTICSQTLLCASCFFVFVALLVVALQVLNGRTPVSVLPRVGSSSLLGFSPSISLPLAPAKFDGFMRNHLKARRGAGAIQKHSESVVCPFAFCLKHVGFLL